MIEALLFPFILALLSYLCLDKEVRVILALWAVVYWLDLALGGVFFDGYPTYFIYSIVNCLVITTVTLQVMTTQWVKALVIVGLSYLDIFFSGYEVLVRWPDDFYPYLSTISWWIIELQLLALISNVKFKIINK